MANVNSFVSDRMEEKIRDLCLAGHFPKVEYKDTGKFRSYSLMEYTELRARIAKLVSDKLIEAGYEKGVFATRLRSKAFQDKATEIVKGLTVDEIKAPGPRYRTWMD